MPWFKKMIDERMMNMYTSTIRTSSAESSCTVQVQRKRRTDPQFLF